MLCFLASLLRSLQQRCHLSNNMKQCRKCGTTADNNAKYCTKCGSLLELTCPNCGAPFTSDCVFCTECGFKIQDSQMVAPSPKETPPTTNPFQEKIEEKVEHKSNNKVLWILLGLVGAAGLSLALFYLIPHLGSESNGSTATYYTNINRRHVYNNVHNKYNCFIVISKKDLALNIYEVLDKDTALIAVFPACLSKNHGQKMGEGDMKTPESSMLYPFTICQIQNSSKWKYDFGDGRGKIRAYGNWFLRLDTGFDGIGIQGSTNNESSVPGRESSGSVRLKDEDIIFLKENYAYIGMKVIIKHEEEGLLGFERKCIEKIG